jgi:hypothetical protein
MVFYVYELRDSKSGLPFYVGKGKEKRMLKHVADVRAGKIPNKGKEGTGNTHLFRKIKQILDRGDEVLHVRIFETEDENLVFQKERELIAQYRILENVSLCNILDGGEGYTAPKGSRHCSEETRKKISEAKKGKPLSPEHRQAMKGRVVSKETREKLGKIRRGAKHDTSEETRQKIREARKGWSPSEQTRQRMATAKKGNTNAAGPRTEEQKLRNSIAQKIAAAKKAAAILD